VRHGTETDTPACGTVHDGLRSLRPLAGGCPTAPEEAGW